MVDGMFTMDCHCHVYPPQKTYWGLIGQTYDQWIERMDNCGIDMALIMSHFKQSPEEQRIHNDYTVEAIRHYPDRFIGQMWSTPMWGDKAIEEMKRGYDMGLRGLKLYPHGHGNFAIDSSLVDPLIEQAAKQGWWVMIHTDIDSKVCNPFLCIRLAKRYPETVFIFSHMGLNPDVTHFIPGYVKDYPNIYLDTSASPNLPQFVYKTPMSIIPDRMLLGSDAPTLSPEVEIKKIEVAEQLYGMTKEEKRKVLGENAARLFGIDISKYKAA